MEQDYFKIVKPTYYENWPSRLRALSVATMVFDLKNEHVDALTRFVRGVEIDQDSLDALEEIERFIDHLVNHYFQGPVFVRLGSRSPKDITWFPDERRITDAEKAVQAIMHSERTTDDLLLAHAHFYQPCLLVRRWVDIQPWQEFRCFVKNRRLKGISQYFYRERFEKLLAHADSIEKAIVGYFEDQVIPALHLDDVIVDVFVQEEGVGDAPSWKIAVLEINPFFKLTDPCLFNWEKDTFETFEFRYVVDESADDTLWLPDELLRGVEEG